MTANLHITVKQAAKFVNVSVRSVYGARQLKATGRDDLCAAVTAGTMSLHRALITAGVKKPPKKDRGLFAAWKNATDGERESFLQWLSVTDPVTHENP